MYRTIIIGFDGTDSGADAVAFGHAIAEATGAQAHVTGIYPTGPFVDHEESQRFAAQVQAAANAIGAHAETFPSGSPAHGLHDAAEELDADLIVVGSSSDSEPGQIRAGIVGVQLLHGAPCAVAVAPSGLATRSVELTTVGVSIDDSDESEQALRAGADLALAAGAKLRIMTAGVKEASAFGWGYGAIDLDEETKAALGQRLETLAAGLSGELEVHTEVLTNGTVADLLRRASDELDLLCLGSRGYGPTKRVLLGSVSASIVWSNPCPVLVVPRGVPARRGE